MQGRAWNYNAATESYRSIKYLDAYLQKRDIYNFIIIVS